MKSLIFISNIADKIDAFSRDAIFAAHECQLSYHSAANWNAASPEQIKSDETEYGISIHHVDINRSPFSLSNIKAFYQIKDLLKQNEITYIHCNTPVGGVLGRLLSKKVKKVIYEAHGFHFYKGAPLKNWLLYYPVEKILARRTDAIITINKDDFEFAKKHLHVPVYYVPGVGIELEQWDNYRNIREEVGLKSTDFVILVVGRLEKNKNCGIIIDAISRLTNVKLVFCGDGEDNQQLQEKVKGLGVADRVLFLGNRTDMTNVYHMADCFVLASFREGLSRSIMEAMACGLPCIVTDIRGNRDLIDLSGGFLFKPTDVDGLVEKIKIIQDSETLREKMRTHNIEKVKDFSLDKVVYDLSMIYQDVFELE